MAEQNAATWIDPTGHKWILPPFTTKLSPWKRIKHKAITDFVYSRACHKCEHCGSPWTEGDFPHNGGCCAEDCKVFDKSEEAKEG